MVFGSLIPAHVYKCISYIKAIGRLIITWRAHCPYENIYIYMHVSINVCMYLWMHGHSMEVTKFTSCHKVTVAIIGRICCIKTIHIYYDHPNLLGFEQSVCFLSPHSSSKYIWESSKRFMEELKSIKIITSIEDYLTCLEDLFWIVEHLLWRSLSFWIIICSQPCWMNLQKRLAAFF